MQESKQERKKRTPKVWEAREFLEIVRDFTDPKEVVREAISNSLDWGANTITISVSQDQRRLDNEIVIVIEDNGMGLNEERLEAFFDLARTTGRPSSDNTGLPERKIGEKGHGTKVFFSSRMIEVESISKECQVYAIMEEPVQKLMNEEVPEYEYDIDKKSSEQTFTRITIRGYNANQNIKDFGHRVLKDYILWFTRFGSVETEFGFTDLKEKTLRLRGLGANKHEHIEFGHRFPEERCDIKKLRTERPGDWTKVFVKRWVFSKRQVLEHPGKYIDIVFYIEGDEAKRAYNDMVRGRGRATEYGMYKVEDRYGLWACKDYIPIKRYNDWLGLGKRMETKFHAFVNCQDFRLTANRGDIGNTPPDLLTAIAGTVKQIYEYEILGSREFQEYDAYAELEQQYQTEQQEKDDFKRRKKLAAKAKVCQFKGVELREPRMEMGVTALFYQIYALEPDLFKFRVIDYDTRRGYDALIEHGSPGDLSRPSMSFLEFKHVLGPDFNHSFANLHAVICWDCNLEDGGEIEDIAGKRRKLQITRPDGDQDYTKYMLVSHTEHHNIEVFVLKDFLREKLDLEFRPRASRS